MPELQGKCKLCDAWVTNNTRPPCVIDDQIPSGCGLLGTVTETRTVETYDEKRERLKQEQADAQSDVWAQLWNDTFKAPYPEVAPGWLEATPETEEYEGVRMTALDEQVGGSHYKDAAIQPIEYIFANELGFCEGNVIKYVTRYKNKNGVQDLKKARHYLDLLIEQIENSDAA